jgi:16S rRNA (guanine1516-N2)-methyltransferase
VHLLLEDAIARAKLDINLQAIMGRMHLIQADSILYLERLEARPDVIYMDPMFPDKTKHSLAKKEMRLFREIAGADEDVNLLLEKALQKAAKRVVIKRPRQSPYVNNARPHFAISGKSSRFDVYMV